MVEIYDSNDWPEPAPGYVWGDVDGTVPDNYLDWEFEHLMSFSPINLTDSPYTSYVYGPHALYDPFRGYKFLDNNLGVWPRPVAFPWEAVIPPTGQGAVYDVKDPFGVHNGVGPAQSWWTAPGQRQFTFRFGHKPAAFGGFSNAVDPSAGFDPYLATIGAAPGLYGVPTNFDGHIPQVFATWRNGLLPGTYYVRAWINGWVQTDISGIYMDYSFTVAAEEWAGDIRIPMDVQLTGWINKTVHFHDLPGTLKTAPIGGPEPWRFMIAEARDAAGNLVAFNFTQVPYWAESAVITLNGFGMAGPVLDDQWNSNDGDTHEPDILTGTGMRKLEYQNTGTETSPLSSLPQPIFNPSEGQWGNAWYAGPVAPTITPNHFGSIGMKFSLYRYRHIRDYGIMPGPYTIYIYLRGSVQPEFELASISLSGAPTIISNHMYRGGGINVTAFSIDWQHPRINRDWIWVNDEDANIYVVQKETGNTMGKIKFFDRTGWALNLEAPSGSWGWNTPEKGPDLDGTVNDPDPANEGEARTAGGNTIPWVRRPDGGGLRWGDTDADGTVEREWTKLKFNGSSVLEENGPEETIGATTPDLNDEMATLWYATIFDGAGFLTSPGSYRDADFRTVLALETGEYGFSAEVYGYVLKEAEKYQVFVQKGYQADTKLNLMIGVNMTFTVSFKKEGIFDETPYSGKVFIRVYDEDGNYVAEASKDFDPGLSVWTTTTGGIVSGIDGYPNYLGDWTIIVDTWYTYRNANYAGFGDGLGPGGVFYPPVPGLLHGWAFEFFRLTLEEEFQLTTEEALQCVCNYLPPYELRTEVIIPNTHLFGEVSVIFELDERAHLTGQIAGFSWSDELRTISWATIFVSGPEGDLAPVFTFDGQYEFFASPGDYELTIGVFPGDAGYLTQTITLTAPDSGSAQYNFLNMERSNIPIPEFPTAIIAVLSALAASLYIFRKAQPKQKK
jgi:hypothetical protein